MAMEPEVMVADSVSVRSTIMDTLSSIFSLRGATPAADPALLLKKKSEPVKSTKKSDSLSRADRSSLGLGLTKSTHSAHSNAQQPQADTVASKNNFRVLREYIFLKKYIETASCTKNKLARMVRKADFEVFNQAKFLRFKVWSVLLPDISPFWAYPLDIG